LSKVLVLVKNGSISTLAGALPRPVMALHVGVTGHRELPGADIDGLRAAAACLFRKLRAEALALLAADQTLAVPLYAPTPPLLRCVCGMAEGADSILAEAALEEDWQLVALLPFAPDTFAADFAGAALDRFHRLLARANVVCALDGDRTSDHAYADVGDQVVEQSDILLTIWNGQRAQGLGGTGDVVRHALQAGVLVAELPPVGVPALSWLGTTDADITAMLRAVLLPPVSSDGFPQACFSDVPRGDVWAPMVLRAYDRLVTLGFTPSAPELPGPVASDPEAGGLASTFRAADQLATEYAARYRAAGLMRYGLILPATLASLVGWYGTDWMQPIGNLVDFVVLLFVVLFSTRGGWEPAHRRFLMYRTLAEYIRNVRLLIPLRATVQMPGAAAHEARAADWTSWYGRAATRQDGIRPASFDAARIADAVVLVRGAAESQVRFLLQRAARFDAIAARLRQIGVALSIAGVAFSGVRAVLLLAGVGPSAVRAFNELALVLPAMAPVFLGLLSFNEYTKLATRYRSVAIALNVQIAALDGAQPHRAAVLPIARRIAEVMLAERDDWRQLMQSRTISAY
jgi:hypothetical protein